MLGCWGGGAGSSVGLRGSPFCPRVAYRGRRYAGRGGKSPRPARKGSPRGTQPTLRPLPPGVDQRPHPERLRAARGGQHEDGGGDEGPRGAVRGRAGPRPAGRSACATVRAPRRAWPPLTPGSQPCPRAPALLASPPSPPLPLPHPTPPLKPNPTPSNPITCNPTQTPPNPPPTPPPSYNEAVAEEGELPPEQRAVANVGKMDARKHLAAAVGSVMASNINQAMGTMLDTVVF